MSSMPPRKTQKKATATGAEEGEAGGQFASPASKLNRTEQRRINDNMNANLKRAVIWIWNHLNEPENVHEILMCREQLMNGICRVSANVDVDCNNSFHMTYVTFGSLPKYWIAANMVQHAGFSAATVDALNGTGKEGRLKHVWTNITGIDDSTHWPSDVHDNVLSVKFLQWCIGRHGERNKKLTFTHDFNIDWDKSGPYKLIWGQRGDMTVVLKILHKDTATEAYQPTYLLVTCQSTSLHTCLPFNMFTYYLPTNPPTYLFTYMHTHVHVYLSVSCSAGVD